MTEVGPGRSSRTRTKKNRRLEVTARNCKQVGPKVDGQWSSWSSWSKCSETCGQGKMRRYRKCKSPAPSSGGKTCPGDRTQIEGCNKDPCGEAELKKKFLNACVEDYKDEVDQVQRLRRLLGAGADINSTDSDGRTCLIGTAGKGRYEASKLLIEDKADVNMKDSDGLTALHLASKYHRTKELVKLLLDNEADPNMKDNDGRTALHIVSKYGSSTIELVKLLLKNEADPNIKDNGGVTAMHIATGQGHLGIVKLLLDSGADPNIKDNDGNSPLIWASSKGYRNMENFLLEHGASPLDDDELKRKQELLNKNLLSVCRAYYKGDLEKVQRLLKAGADINGSDSEGIICLVYAAEAGKYELSKFLLENGADPNIKIQKYGVMVPLYYATKYDHREIEKLLLEHGASPLGFDPHTIYDNIYD